MKLSDFFCASYLKAMLSAHPIPTMQFTHVVRLEFEQAYERWIGLLPDRFIGINVYPEMEALGRVVKATVFKCVRGAEGKVYKTIDERGEEADYTKEELTEYHAYYGGGGHDGYRAQPPRAKRTRSVTPPPPTRREKAAQAAKRAKAAEDSKAARAARAAAAAAVAAAAAGGVVSGGVSAFDAVAKSPSVSSHGSAAVSGHGSAAVSPSVAPRDSRAPEPSASPSPPREGGVHRPVAVRPPKATQAELDAAVAAFNKNLSDPAALTALVATFNRGF